VHLREQALNVGSLGRPYWQLPARCDWTLRSRNSIFRPVRGACAGRAQVQAVPRPHPRTSAERSEFVGLRVSRGGEALSWLQRAPAEPPFGEDRDRAAFVRFLGARGFLLWLAGLLADDGRESEGGWTNDELRNE
jgi:hypothetical protein